MKPRRAARAFWESVSFSAFPGVHFLWEQGRSIAKRQTRRRHCLLEAPEGKRAQGGPGHAHPQGPLAGVFVADPS